MNGIIKFFHQLRHPHCEHCTEELVTSKICDSCETLRVQLERANYDKNELLTRILELTAPKNEVVEKRELVPITQPRQIPWAVRRQMLEAEDRKKAQLLAKAPQPTAPQTVEELEKDIVGEEDALRPSDAQVQTR